MSYHIKEIIHYIKIGILRRDKQGRAYFGVPTHVRRNGNYLVSQATLNKLLKSGEINQSDIDKIRPY